MTHICVSKLTIIGSDNGLAPTRCQAIIWSNTGVLLIGPLGTNFSEISIEIYTFSFKKMHLKMSSGKWRPFCLDLNELIQHCEDWNGLLLVQHQAITLISIDLTLYVLNFSEGTSNIYLHFMSFLHVNNTYVVEIPPGVRQGPAYSTISISWLLMSWRRKEPGHQQPWYWPS